MSLWNTDYGVPDVSCVLQSLLASESIADYGAPDVSLGPWPVCQTHRARTHGGGVGLVGLGWHAQMLMIRSEVTCTSSK